MDKWKLRMDFPLAKMTFPVDPLDEKWIHLRSNGPIIVPEVEESVRGRSTRVLISHRVTLRHFMNSRLTLAPDSTEKQKKDCHTCDAE